MWGGVGSHASPAEQRQALFTLTYSHMESPRPGLVGSKVEGDRLPCRKIKGVPGSP